jgi:hypothetical protein
VIEEIWSVPFVATKEFSVTNIAVTEMFLIAFPCGEKNFLVATKRGRTICFWKALNNIWSLFDIPLIVGWQPKNFDCHLTHPHHQMVTKIFWLPKKESMGCFSEIIADACTPFSN